MSYPLPLFKLSRTGDQLGKLKLSEKHSGINFFQGLRLAEQNGSEASW
jgi:hypothetical protein